MKKLILILCLFSVPTFAYQDDFGREKPVANAVLNKIEMMDGTPKRKFQKLQPLWATAYSMDGAMKKIRRMAAKVGADAVIQVTVGTDKVKSSSGAANALFGAFFGSYQAPQPIVQGWAVKWVN